MRKRIFNAGNFPEGGKKRRRIARRRDILSAVLLDKGGELGTAQGTGVLADDFAVLVNEDGRDAADAVFGGNLVAFINVVLGNDNLAGVGVGSFLKKRAEHTAGGAPRSPEVNKHGLVGNLLDFGVEVGVVYDTDVFAHF